MQGLYHNCDAKLKSSKITNLRGLARYIHHRRLKGKECILLFVQLQFIFIFTQILPAGLASRIVL